MDHPVVSVSECRLCRGRSPWHVGACEDSVQCVWCGRFFWAEFETVVACEAVCPACVPGGFVRRSPSLHQIILSPEVLSFIEQEVARHLTIEDCEVW
jgi:hypothetical protein